MSRATGLGESKVASVECRARPEDLFMGEWRFDERRFVVCFIYANRGLLRNKNSNEGEGGYRGGIEKIKMCIDYN